MRPLEKATDGMSGSDSWNASLPKQKWKCGSQSTIHGHNAPLMRNRLICQSVIFTRRPKDYRSDLLTQTGDGRPAEK